MVNTSENLQQNKIILYQSSDGIVSVDVIFEDETFWLNQKAMAKLFDVDIKTVNEHLQNIYLIQELDKDSTIRNFRIVQKEGKRDVTRELLFYNLDAIISVGYRINSKSATQFRKWATATLKEYIIKGFVLNDTMLKNGKPFGQDYFDELLERIKEIRASERRFYQKITDIYAECSYDYNSNSEEAKAFFQEVQNKLLFAITGHTAPELIANRVDSNTPNMGLTTWKNAPEGKILKSDVKVSKNYLNKQEITRLNDVVNMYLDYAENQARRNKLMAMRDWAERLDAFLQFNEYDLLNNRGTVERKVADDLAKSEYAKYRVLQDDKYVSAFDKSTAKYFNGGS